MPSNSCPIQPHLAVELLVQQDVPCSNVSVDKGLTSQVGQTLSHLAAELEQCDGQLSPVLPNVTAQYTAVLSAVRLHTTQQCCHHKTAHHTAVLSS